MFCIIGNACASFRICHLVCHQPMASFIGNFHQHFLPFLQSFVDRFLFNMMRVVCFLRAVWRILFAIPVFCQPFCRLPITFICVSFYLLQSFSCQVCFFFFCFFFFLFFFSL